MDTKVDKTGLSTRQKKAAQKLASPDFTGTITLLCQQEGVSRQTFYKWLSNQAFMRYVTELIDTYTDSELARVWKALIKKCEAGDVAAIKLYFELKGKYKQDEKTGNTVVIVRGEQEMRQRLGEHEDS